MNLEKMTKKEILTLAKTHNVKGRSLMTKPELIKAVKAVLKKSGVKKIRKKSPVKGYEMAPGSRDAKSVLSESLILDHAVPPYYDQDSLFFLPVEPDGEYAYWEVSNATQGKYKKLLGLDVCKFEIRIHCSDGMQMASQSVGERGDWYFRIWAPLKTLWAELGIWDRDGHFHSIMKSAQVVIPSNIVSNNIDMNWMTVSDNWNELYRLSGADEAKDAVVASMPEHVVRKVREFLSSSKINRKES